MILGNKLDLEANRTVDKQEVSDYCDQRNILFKEVSATRFENVEHAMHLLLEKIFTVKNEKSYGQSYAELVKQSEVQNSLRNEEAGSLKKFCCCL